VNGKVVGQRYQIVRLIGAGGMGSVHEAVDSVTGARIAVKLITAEMAKNATLMGRFEREAKAAATIDTPHIVKVLDAGMDTASDLPFLVLELLEGEDVQQLIKRLGPLRPDLALRIVAQACLGLDRAHESRIIHRDIKPANFFLAKTGSGQRVVKLLDFGIAKIGHDPSNSKAETAGLTRTGSMLGSPLYMSPEQARGHKDIDRRADIWSMGVVLYQALTARTPHQDTDALGELIIAICTEEAAPIQELAPWVAPEVATIAHRAMRFAPEERYQTAADMLDAIRPLLPGGWGIEETMFHPLGDADRGNVQPRLVTLPDMPVTRGSRTSSGGMRSSTPFPAPGLAGLAGITGITGIAGITGPTATPLPGTATVPDAVQASSLEGSTVGRTMPPGPAQVPAAQGASAGRTALMMVLGVLIALALGGALAYWLLRAPEPVPAPTVGTSPPPGTTPPSEPKPRTVKVVILPDEATVEVDGAGVKTSEGTIEITGTLGSVHKVHVTSADGEVLRDVVIAENGPSPAKVEAPAPKSSVPKPTAGRPVAPVAPVAPRPSETISPLRQQR
jgi:eukaryotic-like serine/threonine-protein kinase